MKIKINLFRRIFLFSIFIIIFTVLLSHILSSFVADSFYINRRKQEILKISKDVKKLSVDYEILEDYIDDIKNSKGINIYVSNNINYDSYYDIEYTESYKNIENGFHITSYPNTNIMLLMYKEDLSEENTLFITTSLSVMSTHRREVSLLNLLTLIITLIISAIISRSFSKKITTNIENINRVAKKITNLDFSEQAQSSTTDELNELSKNINIMASSISNSIDNLNSFVSNASHELKTPITIIDTHAQALLRGTISDENEKKKYYRAILKETKEMNILVRDLLLISKLSALDIKLEKENINILQLFKESIEKFEFLELQKDIEWELNIENINFLVNRKLFKVVLDNLIQNALKYSPEESVIKIYSADRKIHIENPMYIFEKNNTLDLFQPFFRGTSATELNIDGNGLGLSIIKKILDLHKIEYEISIKNNFFIFTLTY